MKFILYIILVLSFTESTATENDYIGCWSTVTELKGNTVNVCANRKLATATVHFPNKDGEPTICSQYGYVKSSKKENRIEFDLHEGNCRNGRAFEKSNIKCLVTTSGELKCDHSGGYTLIYTGVKN